MSTQNITLVDQFATSLVPMILKYMPAPVGMLADTRGRLLRDLRISVTDRCNFRCTYCMPKSVFNKDYEFLPQTELLNFDEITRMANLFVAHGVEKIRLTGGEPLLRKNVEVLIEKLTAIKTLDSKPLDIALTTNASLLFRKAQALKDAGLHRITVSLDFLYETVFRAMNDVNYSVAEVLNDIDAAQNAGCYLPLRSTWWSKKESMIRT